MSTTAQPVSSYHHWTRSHPAWGSTPPSPLSKDDVKLLALIATGLPLSSVARRLEISDRTVRRRMTAICDCLGVATTIESVAWAARRRLI